MGGILARHLAKRGHRVSIANSRGPESLTALAAEIGATPVSVVDAAKAGGIVIIAIPTKAVADLPRALFANVPSSVVVIDIGNYHPELRDGRIDAIDRGMLDTDMSRGVDMPKIGDMQMRIGVIGAGSMGGTLARHLARLGHHVSIASSRGPESLTALAAELGSTPASVVDAAKAAEVVILAIPTKAVADLPRGLFANVPSSVVVIDIGNYHPELRDGHIDAIDRGMLDSQWVAQQIGHPVIKAFNNIFAKSLLEKGVSRGTTGRIALSVYGNSSDAKAAVLRLVDDLGFEPVDAGILDESWRQQPGTPAYCRDLEAAALRRALAEADRSRIAEYRAEQEARIRRSL